MAAKLTGHQRGQLGQLVMDVVLDDHLRAQLRVPEQASTRSSMAVALNGAASQARTSRIVGAGQPDRRHDEPQGRAAPGPPRSAARAASGAPPAGSSAAPAPGR